MRRGSIVRDADDDELGQACRIAASSLDLDPEDAAELPKYLWAEESGTERVRLIASVGSEPVGVAIGSIQGDDAFLDLLAVVPEERGRGIGGELLRKWEEGAARAGAARLRVGENLRAYVWPGVDIRYTAALSMLMRAGYARHHVVYNMDVALDTFHGPARYQIERLAAAGIQVRRAHRDDRDTLERHVRRLWSDVWLRETLIAVDKRHPTIFLALRDSHILGFAAHGIYRPALYGPIATDPAEQGHGIGNVLSALCLADMAAHGVRTAQIGWVAESAIPFYSRTAGARLGRCFWMLAKGIPARTSA